MPKIVDAAAKRAELVEASWEVIARDGLRGATLRRVAAAAGCTTGQLTHYFPGRHDLLVEALRAVHFAAGARMVAAEERARGPRERLEAVLLESLPLDTTRLREWRVWLAFWGEAMHERRLAAWVREALPGVPLSLSHEVMPKAPEFERTSTTVVNAYVGPRVTAYLDRLTERLREAGYRQELLEPHLVVFDEFA